MTSHTKAISRRQPSTFFARRVACSVVAERRLLLREIDKLLLLLGAQRGGVLKQRLLLGEHQRVWAAVPSGLMRHRQMMAVENLMNVLSFVFRERPGKLGALRVVKER